MTSEMLLEVAGLHRRFGGLSAVDGLSFNVREGEIVSLIGPNGAGKTTAFNVITGIYPPTDGDIRFASRSLVGLAPHRVCACGIGRTFQNLRIFPNLTVRDNVLVGFTLANRASLLSALVRLPSQRREEKRLNGEVDALLHLLGLAEFEGHLARNLAYGDQRRVEIARALAAQPRMMMLDEPAAGMNPAEIEDLNRLIRRMRDELGKTILLVEHHMNLVMGISDRVVVMDQGRKIAEGTPQEVKRDTSVIRAYLGSEADA